MPSPLPHPKIVKKHPKVFRRHHSDRYKRLANSGWRKPRGIDNAVRRRFDGQIAMPKIGYGSNKRTRHMNPQGFKTLVVSNVADLEVLLVSSRTHAAEIAHNVSAPKRVSIVERAKALGVKVTNPKGRVTLEA